MENSSKKFMGLNLNLSRLNHGKMVLKRCDAAAMPKARDIERIKVTGFDIALGKENLENALREHFASCGKITDVFVDTWKSRKYVGFVYFLGEGSVEKALKLNGTDVGGWKVRAKAYPFEDNNTTTAVVSGYSNSLVESELKTVLSDLFSSCGDVKRVDVFEDFAVVRMKGIEAGDKARDLNGSNIGTHKIVVTSSGSSRFTKHPRGILVGRFKSIPLNPK